MKVQLLPSTFDEHGGPSLRQHLCSFVVDDAVAFDAGSLAMACSNKQREKIRDIVLTHAHLDHIAGLPLFIDDLYSTLKEPITIHAASEVIEVLERDIFNWSVYPKFSELENEIGPVMAYRPFEVGGKFQVRHLKILPVAVNHRVPTSGFIISDESSVIAMSGDTSSMDGFWLEVNRCRDLGALLIECAFPDEMSDLAAISHHLTPRSLAAEVGKLEIAACPVYIINIKPLYRERVIDQLDDLKLANLHIFEVGKIYDL